MRILVLPGDDLYIRLIPPSSVYVVQLQLGVYIYRLCSPVGLPPAARVLHPAAKLLSFRDKTGIRSIAPGTRKRRSQESKSPPAFCASRLQSHKMKTVGVLKRSKHGENPIAGDPLLYVRSAKLPVPPSRICKSH